MPMTISLKAIETAVPAGAEALRLLLVDDDDWLLADAAGLAGEDLGIETISSIAGVDLARMAGRCDVLALSLDLSGGLDLLESLSHLSHLPPIVALASRALPGHTLEHTLTLAELRGAQLTLPKPIDAAELALASLRLLAKRRQDTPAMRDLARVLERRIA